MVPLLDSIVATDYFTKVRIQTRHFNIELFHLLFQSNIFEVSILAKVHLPLLCLHWSKPFCCPIFLPETKKPQKCCDSGKGYEIHPQVGENPFLNEMFNTNSHNCVGPNPVHDRRSRATGKPLLMCRHPEPSVGTGPHVPL